MVEHGRAKLLSSGIQEGNMQRRVTALEKGARDQI